MGACTKTQSNKTKPLKQAKLPKGTEQQQQKIKPLKQEKIKLPK